MAKNRCPKCDNDRFLVDKKGNLVLEKVEEVDKATGELIKTAKDGVKCSHCGYILEFRA